MNSQFFPFDRPKAVVQLFANDVDILKPVWRNGTWRDIVAWKPELRSLTGWVADDTLILNESILERLDDLVASDIILMVDSNNYMIVPPPVYITSDLPGGITGEDGVRPTFQAQIGPRRGTRDPSYFFAKESDGALQYSTFDLVRNDGEIELYFIGSRGILSMPQRGDFKIADLPKGLPVRTIANGRFDKTDWFYRDDRVYRYNDDIFVYLGDINRVEVRPWNEMLTLKPVPLAEARVVNLEKDLY